MALRKRRAGQPAWAIAIADRAMKRLHRKWRRLDDRGVHHNKITAAVARELAGFVWDLLAEHTARQQQRSAA